MLTEWGKAINPGHVLEEYPRPSMRRPGYTCLNGFWDYAFTGSESFPDSYEGRILVPFSPEAPLSGVNRQLLPEMFLHYRRTFPVEHSGKGERLLLHFGAVDQSCKVYVNGRKAGEHMGGYLAFSLDTTSFVHEGENVLQVVVRDLSDTSYHAKGKQSLERGGGDLYSIHNYFRRLKVKPDPDRCVGLTEFGGYSWHMPDHSWGREEYGYRKYHSEDELTEAIEKLWLRDLIPNTEKGLSASVYTQVSDVEDETNGLLTYDRKVVKVHAQRMVQINRKLIESFEKATSGISEDT